LSQSATCRQWSTKRNTMSRPEWPDSINSPSEKPGTVHSPILQGIQAIWLRYMDSKDISPADDRHLLIVSDLVQHTPGLSFYPKPLSFESLKANQQYQQVRVNLKRAKVEVLFLKHHDGIQVDPLIRLWEQILDDMAGDLQKVERVTG